MPPLDYIRLGCQLDKYLARSAQRIGAIFTDLLKGEVPVINPYQVYGTFIHDIERVIMFISKVDEQFGVMGMYIRELRKETPQPEAFDKIITRMIGTYLKYRSGRLELLQALTREEDMRINEAWHCLLEQCYYAAIVNSAVALESRLWKMLESKNSSALQGIPRYPKISLGQLSKVYLDNKAEFDEVVPAEFDSVLWLVNDYRIISAHAKNTLVNKTKSEALFGFVLEFLLDPRCIVLV